MRYWRFIFIYVSVVGISLLILWLLNQYGTHLLAAPNASAVDVTEKGGNVLSVFFGLDWDRYFHDPKRPFILLLLQLSIILISCRVLGFLVSKIGFQRVIGEIIAGLILGPSVLGQYFPKTEEFIFPEYSKTSLYIVSQIGLILYMFVVGMEVNFRLIRTHGRQALLISHGTIGLTSMLGFILAILMFPVYAPEGTNFTVFSLFISISLSITAFPLMARILDDNGILKTKTGNMLMSIAAIDDVTAWTMVAVLTGIAGSQNSFGFLSTLLLTLLYTAIMFGVLKPWLQRMSRDQSENKNSKLTAYFILTLLFSSFCTRFIGLHALFGAFIAGIIMPVSAELREKLTNKIQDMATILFLPAFFTLAGLRAHIEKFQSDDSWTWALIVILFASAGKIAGGTLISKAAGFGWRKSFFTGMLLNTRGMVEIVVLNIGLDAGIINTELYTVFLIMTLVTTLITPLAIRIIGKNSAFLQE